LFDGYLSAILGFEILYKRNGQVKYRCIICNKGECLEKNVRAHLKSAGHRKNLEELNALHALVNPPAQPNHPGATSCGLLGTDTANDTVFQELVESPSLPSENMDLDGTNAAEFGFASDDSDSSDSLSDLSMEMEDWVSDDADQDEDDVASYQELLFPDPPDMPIGSGPESYNTDYVSLESPWYPFPTKEVGILSTTTI
jgi:hypothetical protein